MGGLDHKFRKYRLRAKHIFEFLTPGFKNFSPSLRFIIIELLATKTDAENITQVNGLLFHNVNLLDTRLTNLFVEAQLDKDLVTPKMAIGYLKRFILMSPNNEQRLRTKVLTLKKGAYILARIRTTN